MRRLLVVPLVALAALAHAGETNPSATGDGVPPAAAPSPADLAKADEQAKAGMEAMIASNADPARTVDAAMAFSAALPIYEAANQLDKAREMQANIYWCKKRMNIDDLERYVAAKGKDPGVAADLARIDAVVDKKIPLEEADKYLAEADAFALENPDKGVLIAVRYFEVAERFVGTPASLKAQRKSLDYQAKAGASDGAGPRETLFSRPVATPQGRQPMPSAAEQKVGKDMVRKLFKDDFAGRKSESDRRALGWQLYAKATASKDDPKLRHALLTEAIALAGSTRDIAGILSFTDELANGFDGIDATAEKKAHLAKMKTDPAAGAVLKLLDDPKDPAANAVAGKYFCLTAGKMDVGLPLLALGSDPVLATIAGMELGKPQGAAQQTELADAWYAQGNGRTDQGIAAWTRASHWYRQALPGLNGVSKQRVEQVLEDLFPAVIPPDFDFKEITDKQWDKLKGTAVAVSAAKAKIETGVVLRDGQRARVVPHPTDTWFFNGFFSNDATAMGWRGQERGLYYLGAKFPTGAMLMWVQEGQQMAPGIITGPGKLCLGANSSEYASKGSIRAKIIILDD
jgi:hypothetical protein